MDRAYCDHEKLFGENRGERVRNALKNRIDPVVLDSGVGVCPECHCVVAAEQKYYSLLFLLRMFATFAIVCYAGVYCEKVIFTQGIRSFPVFIGPLSCIPWNAFVIALWYFGKRLLPLAVKWETIRPFRDETQAQLLYSLREEVGEAEAKKGALAIMLGTLLGIFAAVIAVSV